LQCLFSGDKKDMQYYTHYCGGQWKMENGKWKMENGKWKVFCKKNTVVTQQAVLQR